MPIMYSSITLLTKKHTIFTITNLNIRLNKLNIKELNYFVCSNPIFILYFNLHPYKISSKETWPLFLSDFTLAGHKCTHISKTYNEGSSSLEKQVHIKMIAAIQYVINRTKHQVASHDHLQHMNPAVVHLVLIISVTVYFNEILSAVMVTRELSQCILTI